jgi:hypothetical protein
MLRVAMSQKINGIEIKFLLFYKAPGHLSRYIDTATGWTTEESGFDSR